MGKQFRFIMDEMDKKAFFEYVRYAGRIFETKRGRLYLEMKYYDASGVLIQKSELLDKWYRELVSWIKKQLQCVEVSSNGKVVKEYVSKSLVKLVEEGYHLLG